MRVTTLAYDVITKVPRDGTRAACDWSNTWHSEDAQTVAVSHAFLLCVWVGWPQAWSGMLLDLYLRLSP